MSKRFPRYERLLRLLPRAYRERYAPQMLQTLADMLDDQSSRAGRVRVWLRAGADLPRSVIHENALALGKNLMNDTPRYIRLSGMLTGIMLIPFMLAVLANAADEAISGRALYQTWLWNASVLRVWVMVLPWLALLLACVSYLLHVIGSGGKAGPLTRILDFRHAWPVMLTGVCAAGVLFILYFHDSGRCVTGNPLDELRNWHQTLHCIWQR